MSEYKRSTEKEFARGEIDRSVEDDYREDAERKEYEEIVYEVQQYLHDQRIGSVIKFIDNLSDEQRREVLDDRRVLWSAFGELRLALESEHISICYSISEFFFKCHPEWLTMPEMVKTAKDNFGHFLREVEDVEEYFEVLDNILCDKESKEFVSTIALQIVSELVVGEGEIEPPHWPRALFITDKFLKDNKPEVLNIFKPALVHFIGTKIGIYEKTEELKDIKKDYPELFKEKTIIQLGKQLIISQISSNGDFGAISYLQELFALSDADLAADKEISMAAREYLVENLSTDLNAIYEEDPNFQMSVKIAGVKNNEMYAGIYKEALIVSLRRIGEYAQLEDGTGQIDPAWMINIASTLNAKMLDSYTKVSDGSQTSDKEGVNSYEEKRMDPEVKEAIKNAFVSVANSHNRGMCVDLDRHFIISEELLLDEDLGKAKEKLLADALVDMDMGYARWLSHFIFSLEGQAIQRAAVKAIRMADVKVNDKFNFLRRILEKLPLEIHRMREGLDKEVADVKKNGLKIYSRTVKIYKDYVDEGKDFGWDFENIKEDSAIKEGINKIYIDIFKTGNSGQVQEMYCLLAEADKSIPIKDFEPDKEIIEAARIGALTRAEEIDFGLSTFKYFDWLADTIFKKHPEIVTEVSEKKYISVIYHADLQGLKTLYSFLKKVRPEAPISREMAQYSIPRYEKTIKDFFNDWSVADWLENVVFASHPDVLTTEEKDKIAKEGAISNLERGFFINAQNILETYLKFDADAKKECFRIGLHGLLRTGDLRKLKLIDGQIWIKKEAPEILEEIIRERDTLVGLASKVGVMAIGTDGQQYQPSEWSTMARVLVSGEIVLGDKKKEATGISRIRKEIMAEYEKNKEFVVLNPYKALFSYLGDDVEVAIWEYLGQRDKHQMLEPVEEFVRSMATVEANDGINRKDTVQNLFVRAGMGSGMQADVWRNIMGKVTPQIWNLLETTSAYPDAEPPLANKENINLLRIQNEIKLHQTPELRKAVVDIPKDKPKLRAYAAELMKYPTINIEAIVRFIKNPKAFWASRSGAGEDNRVVSALLRELDPSAYPNWSAEQSRDAIVEGSYDKLNSFEPIAVEWSEVSSLRSELDFWAVLLESIETPDTAIRKDVFRGMLRDVHTKLEKADPALAEKSDREIDIHAWAAYATSDETLDVSVEWCKAKGKIYAKKAVEYDLKQKLAEPKNQLAVQERYKKGLEARLGKSFLGDDERAQIEGNIRLAAERIQTLNDSITAVMKSVEAQTSTFVSNLEKLNDEKAGNSSEEKKKIVQEFWAQVERTDFKVNVFHLAKQIAGKEFSSMEEFREFTLAHADKRELIARLSGYLDEAEKSDNIDWYQAEVLKPSSVESAIAGTLSATCDAFGSGKKAHFMTNPVCTQFVVRSAKGRPKEWNADHIISQSLMTDNRQLFDKPQDRWDFFTELVNSGGKIAQALTKIGFTGTVEDFLKKYANAEELIVLDSVEVPVNVQKKMTPSDVYKCLQSAFFQIVQKNPRYDKSVRLGTQYSYVKGDSFPHAPNTDVWVAPLAYSDNLGMEQHKDSSIVLRDRKKDAEPRKEIFEGPVNVRPARPQDALAIAMMEDIAFRRTGGERYITGLLAMTRNLNAACLQSMHNEHAPIAFIEEHTSDKGDKGEKGVTGYLIAQTRQSGDIYIDDTATTGEVKGTGTRLIMKLLFEASADEQLKKKTIRMDCRGTTSALAISKSSSVSLLKMMGYRLEGPAHEEVEKQKNDRLFSYALVPMERIIKN